MKTNARPAHIIAIDLLRALTRKAVSRVSATNLDTMEMAPLVVLSVVIDGQCLRKSAMTTIPTPWTDALHHVPLNQVPFVGSLEVHGILRVLAVAPVLQETF